MKTATDLRQHCHQLGFNFSKQITHATQFEHQTIWRNQKFSHGATLRTYQQSCGANIYIHKQAHFDTCKTFLHDSKMSKTNLHIKQERKLTHSCHKTWVCNDKLSDICNNDSLILFKIHAINSGSLKSESFG